MPWTYELADLFSDDSAPIKTVAYSPNGELIATADVRRTVRIWRGEELIFEKRFRAAWDRLRAIDHVRALAFDTAGKHLFIAAGNRSRVIEIDTAREMPLSGRKPTLGFMVTCPVAIAVSKNDQIAIAHDDGIIEIIDWNTRKPVSSWSDNESPSMIHYAHDGQRIVGTDRYSVCVWDPLLGMKVGRLAAEKVYSFCTSPVSALIAVRNLKRLAVWDMDSGTLLATMDTLHGLPTLDFSRNGRVIAAGDTTGFSIFDFEGRFVERVTMAAPVISLAFSPSEDKLAVATSNGRFSIWDYSKRALEA